MKRDKLTDMAGRALFAEYILYLQNRRRLLATNFLAGLMRGAGFAVGFSLLGALVVVLVRRFALDNLPWLGAFFTEVLKMIQTRRY